MKNRITDSRIAEVCECGHRIECHEGFTLPHQKEAGCSEWVETDVFCSCTTWRPVAMKAESEKVER